MQTELPHAQVAECTSWDVGTPLIAPSFSSQGFPHLSDIWEEFRHKLYGVCLVSAFDIAGGRIPASVADTVNVVILDSGLYETKKGSGESGCLHTPSVEWTRNQYHEVVTSTGKNGNVMLVNFDHVGRLEDQSRELLKTFPLPLMRHRTSWLSPPMRKNGSTYRS